MLTEREQFEAWMRDQGEDYLYRRDSPGSSRLGEYCRIGVQQSWECWQAASVQSYKDIGDALYTHLMRGAFDIGEAYLKLKVVGSCPSEADFLRALLALIAKESTC